MVRLEVHISVQKMFVFDHTKLLREYDISTAKNGVGEIFGSEQTPRGKHIIRAKIGAEVPMNAVFVNRRLTGEIYTPTLREKFPSRDWILTRIFWLSGLEVGKNRLGKVDTMRRFIYIHGSPEDVKMGVPGSRGCIRMTNESIVELFSLAPVGAPILIDE